MSLRDNQAISRQNSACVIVAPRQLSPRRDRQNGYPSCRCLPIQIVALHTPKLKKRTALLRKLKDMFGRNQSQPVGRVVKLINPVLRGWVNYFAVGHSSECFSFVKDWVEKKIKRHMQRARNRQGFGWTRWSREWTYNTLGLFKGYRVVRPALKAVPAG